MPGIVGCITRLPRDRAQAELVQMVDALCHEDFYVTGVWAEESLGVYVGWVAQQGSFSDAMPVRNERGEVVLVFSGEEFSQPGAGSQLRAHGHVFDSSGSSYLVHLYEDDPSFPAGLNGRFHGLLVDRNRGTTMLFNDRFGMHRIYYHESNDAFYFAAEAKAILAVLPELRYLNSQSVGEFIACGCTLDNRSLFKDIHVLPGAAKWTFRNRQLEQKGKYFDPHEWEEQDRLEPEDYYRELRDVFSGNLPRYFKDSGRIGMSLTGGLDTRMIMAWHKGEPGSLPCYTFGGMRRDCRDVIVAREVARVCGQPHQVVPVEQDFLAEFPRYAERAVYLTDGGVDVSRAPDLYLSERAREIAPVRMTGLYGSEVLRGVRAFKPEDPLPGLFSPDVIGYARQADETYAGLAAGHPVTFAAFKQGPWYSQGSLTLEQTQYSVRTPFLDNDFVRTVFRAPQGSLATRDVSWQLIADGRPDLLWIPTDRGIGGRGNPVSQAISHSAAEFLFKAEYAYDMGMPQWLARVDHALSPFRLERLFLGRHKIFHFRTWYRDTFAGYLQQMLLDPRSLSRPYIERKVLETMVRRHLQGDGNYTTDIHKVLTLELLHRLFLDSSSRRDRWAEAARSENSHTAHCGAA